MGTFGNQAVLDDGSELLAMGPCVLCVPIPLPAKIGAIVLPDNHKQRPSWHRIVAVGPEVKLDLRVGDQILFANGHQSTILVGGELYNVIGVHEGQVFGRNRPSAPGAK